MKLNVKAICGAATPNIEARRETAAVMNITEGAVKMAAHRLRGRYRQLLRDEIGRTVADPAEVDDEIAALLAAIGT